MFTNTPGYAAAPASQKPPRNTVAISRRAAMTLALAAPLTVRVSQTSSAVESVLSDIIQRTEEQAAAFMAGDMTRWASLIQLDDNFTLMQPFGGPASHGFDDSPAHLAELARFFRNGGGTLEVEKSYVSADMIVLVMIERQHGEVGGLPDQNWSLRVTQVYRRHGSDWRLAHRHADPLVGKIGLDQAAALARGA